MRRSIALFAFLSLAPAAQANDSGELSLRTKALVSASSVSTSPMMPRHADAPFNASRDPLPQMLLSEEQEARGLKGGCDTTAKDFCYDLAERRIVYRAAREYMPTVGGLSPEGVALRHNRIVLRYSFR
jgi:hypothetical protein